MDIPRGHKARKCDSFIITNESRPEIPWLKGREYRLVRIINTVLNKSIPLLVVTKLYDNNAFMIIELSGKKWYTLYHDIYINDRILCHMSFRRFYAALKRYERASV